MLRASRIGFRGLYKSSAPARRDFSSQATTSAEVAGIGSPRAQKRKVAIVTGGTGGIGFAASEQLGRDGYDLILGYLEDEAKAAKAKSYLQKTYNLQVETVRGDLINKETIPSYFKALDENFEGILCALVHCAGKMIPEMLSKDPNTFFTTFEVYDFFQMIYPKSFICLIENGVKRMEDGNGYIVTLSNPGCNLNDTPRLGYMMAGQAKATLEYLVNHYAKQLAPRQITCNCIIPGFVHTKEWNTIIEKIGTDKFAEERTPMGRWGQPVEIGSIIGVLCSNKSSFTTGAMILVDGGLRLGKHLDYFKKN